MPGIGQNNVWAVEGIDYIISGYKFLSGFATFIPARKFFWSGFVGLDQMGDYMQIFTDGFKL